MNIEYDAHELRSGKQVQGTLSGTVDVLDAENFSQLVFYVSVEDVFAYRRDGDDLVIILLNGERIRLDSFFTAEQPALVFVRGPDPDGAIGIEREEADDFIEVRFVDGAPGFLTPSYSDVVIANPGSQPSPSPGMTSVGAGAALAILAVVGGAGGSAKGTKFQNDTTAPDPASGLSPGTNPDGTMTVTGNAESGARVAITWPDGTAIMVIADDKGQFTAASATPQPAGKVVVTVSDAVGNISDSASVPYTAEASADTTAPAAPRELTGETNPDGTVTITGKAEPGATLEITWPDGTTTSTTVGPAGAFALASPRQQPEGTILAQATDASGNTGAPSEFAYEGVSTSDVTVPDAPVISRMADDSENDRIAGSGSDAITNDDTPTLSGMAEPGAVIGIYDDGTMLGTTIADAAGAWQFTSEALSEGTRSLTAAATDASGNVSAPSVPLSITVDTTVVPPVVTGISEDSGAQASDGITNDATLTIFGTAEPGAVVDVSIGATAIGTAIADAAGDWHYDHTGTVLADGDYLVQARQLDIAGNISDLSAPLSITIDTTGPELALSTPIATDDIVDGAEAAWVVVAGTVTGLPDGTPVTVTFTDRQEAIESVVSQASGGAWSVSADISALADGIVTVAAHATDRAGNASVVKTQAALNTIAPTIEAMSNDDGTAGDFATSASKTQVSGTGYRGEIIEVYVDGVSIGTVAADSTGVWISPEIDLSGPNSRTVTATDAAGNTSPGQTVTKEAGAPAVQTGTPSADWMSGSDGADVLIGGGGADTLLGFGGDDRLHVSDTSFNRIDGGAGRDALVLDGSGSVLDFTAGNLTAGTDVTGIEMIDIAGSGANTLAIGMSDVLALSDTTDTLTVFGDADDTVIAHGFTDSGLDRTVDGHVLSVHTDGTAQLWIEDTVGTVSV